MAKLTFKRAICFSLLLLFQLNLFLCPVLQINVLTLAASTLVGPKPQVKQRLVIKTAIVAKGLALTKMTALQAIQIVLLPASQ